MVPKVLEKLTGGYVACLLGVYFLYPGGGYGSITGDKFTVLAVLTVGYVLSLGVLAVELQLVGQWRIPSPAALWHRMGLVQKLILGYWLWSALSTVAAVDVHTAVWGGTRMEGFVAISGYCLMFLLVSAMGRPERWMLWLAGVAVSLCSGLSLVQLAGGNPLGLYPTGMTYADAFVQYAGQFLGTIGNVDLLAAVLCLAVPMCWVGMVRLQDRRRFLLAIPMGLCLAVLAGCRVEAGILGVCVGGLLAVPVVMPVSPRQRKVLVAAVAGVLVVAVALVYCFGGRTGGGMLFEASELLHGRWDDRFGSGRLEIWRNVLPLIGQRPLLGGGPDTLGLRCDLIFERYHETLGVLIRSTVDNAHNEYLHIAVNQGFPALGLYLAALVTGAVQWVRRSPEDPVCAMLGAGVLGYCVQAFFGLSSVISTPFFWVAFALLCSRGSHEDTTQPVQTGKRRNRT